jgi:peptidoglycan/LPS O-acetylase OafA/YrhL
MSLCVAAEDNALITTVRRSITLLAGVRLMFPQEAVAFTRKNSSPRIPSLDGCRAISILLVILSHLCHTPAFRAFDPYAHLVFHFGPFGVKVFFVISGLVITTLLLSEERRNGAVSIKRFYIRRALRIWPVAYAYLFVVAVLAWKNVIRVAPHHFFYAGAFLMNHVQETNWFTGHFWSLAIEEQFYLVWPLIFLLTARRGRLTCCFLILFLAPLLRTLAYLYEPVIYGAMQLSLLFVGDAIAMGCLLALLSKELESSRILRRIINLRCFFVVPLLSVIMYTALKWLPAFYFAGGDSIALICIAVTLWKVMHVRGAVFRFLNSKAMVNIGVLSYSLYIWQQLFLNPTSTSPLNRLPLNLLLICAVSTFSYLWIEVPFLRLRPRFSSYLQTRRRDVDIQPSASALSAGNIV